MGSRTTGVSCRSAQVYIGTTPSSPRIDRSPIVAILRGRPQRARPVAAYISVLMICGASGLAVNATYLSTAAVLLHSATKLSCQFLSANGLGICR